MGSNRKDRGLFPDGIEKEFRIAALLQRLGFMITMKTEFTEEYATNLLITGHRSIDEPVPPIAIQTSKQRKLRGRAGRFVARAAKHFKGPLLYMRCRGEVSLEKMESLYDVLMDLWFDPKKQSTRAHGIALHADGTYHWFRKIDQPTPQTKDEA